MTLRMLKVASRMALLASGCLFLRMPVHAESAPDATKAPQLDRHVDIKVVVPIAGIKSGLVIAYGHVIPGPYHFQYLDSKLFVNGVQLVPSPVSEKENEQVQALVKDDKSQLLNEFDKIEAQAQAMYESQRSHAEILQFVQSYPAVIAEAKWGTDNVMVFRLAGEKFLMHQYAFVGLNAGTRKQALETQDPEQLRATLIKRYEGDLERNGCLFFASDNGVLRIPDPRRKVLAVMTNASLSGDAQLKALLGIFPHRIAAYDVMANFSATEWTPKAK